ncbi:MAG: hypothetical protein G01um101448_831 [Parcubacteria group bacterium Gr01-1014_48]|nr:MAG: hypothetical protein G01um101448_831 [Parcubacteria group bacterium Gr01-1014_48]
MYHLLVTAVFAEFQHWGENSQEYIHNPRTRLTGKYVSETWISQCEKIEEIPTLIQNSVSERRKKLQASSRDFLYTASSISHCIV